MSGLHISLSHHRSQQKSVWRSTRSIPRHDQQLDLLTEPLSRARACGRTRARQRAPSPRHDAGAFFPPGWSRETIRRDADGRWSQDGVALEHEIRACVRPLGRSRRGGPLPEERPPAGVRHDRGRAVSCARCSSTRPVPSAPRTIAAEPRTPRRSNGALCCNRVEGCSLRASTGTRRRSSRSVDEDERGVFV